MPQRKSKNPDPLKLTREEAESLGVQLGGGPAAVAETLRDRPLHEQVVGALTEEDVAEALTGEVSEETMEAVDEEVADQQETAVEQE